MLGCALPHDSRSRHTHQAAIASQLTLAATPAGEGIVLTARSAPLRRVHISVWGAGCEFYI